ncbi:MAG: helix-turn-helix transcriptional regulator [Nitrospira sp. SB0662_bin_26]|nr:helix-turn-helix transcriptional regulator [Nitrospira sp. SB0662_bin_26]
MNRNARLLTRRQLEIVELMLDGLRDREIAAVLGVSPRTVSTHFYDIYNRLGVHSKVQLLRCLLKVKR